MPTMPTFRECLRTEASDLLAGLSIGVTLAAMIVIAWALS